MPLHQELTRFGIKCCILRKKAGRSIQILENNYYAWSFEMTMQKILKFSEVDFSMVKFEVIFLNKFRLY
jgi:hypothetical protein